MATKKNAPAPAFVVGDEEQYRKPDFEVKLVGVTYPVFVPKSMASIALARSVKTDKKGRVKEADRNEALDAIMEWVKQAFDEEDARKLEQRLHDPKDRIDIEHMTEFMEKVNEYQTQDSGNPTT
ncbi:MAG TPA: hypothetical protein VK065_01695 [Brevibacterium sp.]|nr:hypothetical protein [Brevibacterium sp.]